MFFFEFTLKIAYTHMSQQRKITHVIDMLIIFKYKIFKIIAASNNGFQ